MKTLIAISRIVVGTLFIISGLIKANDSKGFSYKLEEYFDVFTKDITYNKTAEEQPLPEEIANSSCKEKFKPEIHYTEVEIPESERGFITKTFVSIFKFSRDNALALAVGISVIEILLGLFTIVGFQLRLTSWLLMLMIIFFGFLTFYSAYYNKVTDCGCFGDALKLKPWESFIKDMLLLVFILPVFFWNKRTNGNEFSKYEKIISIASVVFMAVLCIVQFKWYFPILFLAAFVFIRWVLSIRLLPKMQHIALAVLCVLSSSVFAVNCINDLPMKDYRPWKIGNNLRPLREYVAEVAEVKMMYIDKKTCEEKLMPTDYWDWFDSTFEANHIFYKQEKKVTKESIDAKVKDMSLEDIETGESRAEEFFANTGYSILVVMPKINEADMRKAENLRAISNYALENNILILGSTSTGNTQEIDEFKHQNQLPIDITTNDEKALKTIIRSNPGIVLVKDGKVINKWSARKIPTVDTIKEYLK